MAKKKEARLRRILRLAKMAALGRHYKMPREKGKKKPKETERTKDITERLRKAGLTDAEIKRMRGRR